MMEPLLTDSPRTRELKTIRLKRLAFFNTEQGNSRNTSVSEGSHQNEYRPKRNELGSKSSQPSPKYDDGTKRKEVNVYSSPKNTDKSHLKSRHQDSRKNEYNPSHSNVINGSPSKATRKLNFTQVNETFHHGTFKEKHSLHDSKRGIFKDTEPDSNLKRKSPNKVAVEEIFSSSSQATPTKHSTYSPRPESPEKMPSYFTKSAKFYDEDDNELGLETHRPVSDRSEESHYFRRAPAELRDDQENNEPLYKDFHHSAWSAQKSSQEHLATDHGNRQVHNKSPIHSLWESPAKQSSHIYEENKQTIQSTHRLDNYVSSEHRMDKEGLAVQDKQDEEENILDFYKRKYGIGVQKSPKPKSTNHDKTLLDQPKMIDRYGQIVNHILENEAKAKQEREKEVFNEFYEKGLRTALGDDKYQEYTEKKKKQQRFQDEPDLTDIRASTAWKQKQNTTDDYYPRNVPNKTSQHLPSDLSFHNGNIHYESNTHLGEQVEYATYSENAQNYSMNEMPLWKEHHYKPHAQSAPKSPRDKFINKLDEYESKPHHMPYHGSKKISNDWVEDLELKTHRPGYDPNDEFDVIFRTPQKAQQEAAPVNPKHPKNFEEILVPAVLANVAFSAEEIYKQAERFGAEDNQDLKSPSRGKAKAVRQHKSSHGQPENRELKTFKQVKEEAPVHQMSGKPENKTDSPSSWNPIQYENFLKKVSEDFPGPLEPSPSINHDFPRIDPPSYHSIFGSGMPSPRRHQRTLSAPETPRKNMHLEAVRKHHQHKRSTTNDQSTGNQVGHGTLTPAFSNSSLDRYFSSLKEISRDGESVSDSFEPIPEQKIDLEDMSLRDSDAEMRRSHEVLELERSIRVGGITERLQRMGIDLTFLKGKESQSNDSKDNHDSGKHTGEDESNKDNIPSSPPQEVLVCPECAALNKTYLSWCMECSCVLIGVEPVPVKQRKSRIPVKAPDHSINTEKVKQDHVNPPLKAFSHHSAPAKQAQSELQLDEWFKPNYNADDKKQSAIPDNDRDQEKHAPFSGSMLVEEKNNQPTHFSAAVNGLNNDSSPMDDAESLKNETLKSELSIDLNMDDSQEESNEDEERKDINSQFHHFFQNQKKKHNRTVSHDSEIEVIERNGCSNFPVRQSNDDVPSLNLSDSDKDRAPISDTDDEEDEGNIEPPQASNQEQPDPVSANETNYTIQRVMESSGPKDLNSDAFLEKLLEDPRVKPAPERSGDKLPTKSKSKPRAVQSKVKASIENEPYKRKWARSSLAWSSYNPGEIKARSTLQPSPSSGRPSSAKGQRTPQGQGRSSGSNVDTGSSTENIARRKRPSSAVVSNSSSRESSHKRPSSANVNNSSSTESSHKRPFSANVNNSSRGSANRQKSSAVNSSRDLGVQRPLSAKNHGRSQIGRVLDSGVTESRDSGDVKLLRRPSSGDKGMRDSHSQAWNGGARPKTSSNMSGDRPRSGTYSPTFPRRETGQGDRPWGSNYSPTLSRREIGQGDGAFSIRPALVSSGIASARSKSAMKTYDKYIEMSPRILEGDFSMWLCLPDEIWLHIFCFLSHKELNKCTKTCKHFHRIGSDDALWKHIYIEKKPHFFDEWLVEIGQHHPTSLSLVQCLGNGVTVTGLRELFRHCATSLQEINIPRCNQGSLTGDNILLHAAARCQNISRLDLSWCNVNDNGIVAICEASKRLVSVKLNGCQMITDDSIDMIATKHGKSLETLEVFGCYNVTPMGMEILAEHCKGLKSLNVGQCHRLSDACIVQLSESLSQIRNLDLRGLKQIKDNCIRKIVRKCPHLKMLVLANCLRVTDVALIEVSTYTPNVRWLDASGCRNITNQAIGAVSKNCRCLEYLDVSSTGITHLSVIMLANNCSDTLQTLKISFCQDITESSIVKLVRNCRRLDTLHLYGCKGIRTLDRILEIKPNLKVEK